MTYMIRWGPANKRMAIEILRERCDELTGEQKKYLQHVFEEGTRCEEWLRELEHKREKD